MASDDFWMLALCVLGFVAILMSRLSYKHGVWDGAFNQFLPHVQKAMREYDPRRAEQLLSVEEPPHAE